jgi:arsenate reductase (thioredoxin)
MSQNPVIIFVCEHGAAKSIIAATYFNKLAREKHLDVSAIARGTHPDAQLSQKAIEGLHEDRLGPIEAIPIKLSAADLESAQRIVTFCELPEEYRNNTPIEEWDDIPPVNEDYKRAREAILRKLNTLF